jgi:hypothetical protein
MAGAGWTGTSGSPGAFCGGLLMDETRSIETDEVTDREYPAAQEPRMDAPPAIGADERRMHVRAYNYWVSLLNGRDYPSIEDLDPASIDDFGPHSVLVDFSAGPENPAIPFLGKALREEGGIGYDVRSVKDVPGRSLLSRLTDHYMQIIANRAPIGFEAEFVNNRGEPTLYRGILMPFSSDDDTIDFIYGVINWKVQAEPDLPADIVAAIGTVLSDPKPVSGAAPVWADGPSAAPLEDDLQAQPVDADDAVVVDENAGLYDHLAAARETAEVVKSAEGRSRAALYRALGLCYDFALVAEARPDEYAELLEDSGLKAQARAPMTPIVKLVFGADYDKTRLTEFAAALAHGRRLCLGLGMLRDFLESHEGGLKGVVLAERRERRPAARSDKTEAARILMRGAPPRAIVDVGAVDEEFVLLMARREADGSVAVLAPVPADSGLLDRAMRKMPR